MHDFAKVNRQALQLTVASYALVATLAYGVLSAEDMLRQFVLAPAVTGTACGLLNTYFNHKDAAFIDHRRLFAGKVLNRIWLFFPMSIAGYACIVIVTTGSYEGLRWIGPYLGIPLGQQISDYVFNLRRDT